ncbi:MAG: serine--tRNA ligase, partial [Bacteroidales bacterium]|nr:serine--tRNA ligase [Bacteroidales bacterium]
MLEINKIRLNKENVIELLGVKNFKDADQKINTLIDLDEKKRQVQKQLEDIKADLNVKAKEIGKFMMQGEKDLAEKTKEEVAALKENSKDLEKELSEKEREIEELLLSIPNLPHSSVPKGKTAEDNIVELIEGEIPKLWEGATPHWDLCAKYDIVDFELGNKITGSGFPVYKGKGAKLQRALINFFLDEATKNGFDEVQPPLMVNEASAMATGQLPDKEG